MKWATSRAIHVQEHRITQPRRNRVQFALLSAGFSLGLLFDFEDGSDMFLYNII
jgi:hypothetical protein